MKHLLLIFLVGLCGCQSLQTLQSSSAKVEGAAHFDTQTVYPFIPCDLDIKAPIFATSTNEQVLGVDLGAMRYNYPIRQILQDSYEASVFNIFNDASTNFLNSIRLEVNLTKTSLKISGGNADYTGQLTTRLLSANGREIFNQSYVINKTSTLDGSFVPNCVYDAIASLIKNSLGEMLSDKRTISVLESLKQSNFQKATNGNHKLNFQPIITVKEKVKRTYENFVYDAKTRLGTITVNNAKLEDRDWIIAQIEKIISSKNIVLEAGKKPQPGFFKVLSESLNDKTFKIDFEATY